MCDADETTGHVASGHGGTDGLENDGKVFM